MPTLLTNAKMSPELRRRIESSLSSSRCSRERTRTVGLQRLVVALGLLAAFCLVWSYRVSRDELDASRASLIASFHTADRRITLDQRRRLGLLDGVVERVVRADGASASAEFVDPRIERNGLVGLLAGARLIVGRGDLDVLRDTGRRWRHLDEPVRDAFVHCVLAPPESDKESVLLRAVGGSAVDARFVGIGRAWRLLSFSAQDWEAKARALEHKRQVDALRASFERERVSDLAAEVHGDLLLLVVDEPLEPGKPSDFDGEGEHFVRIAIHHLAEDREVLRLRRLVDPAWISERSRVQFSRPLDSCKLAYELHRELSPAVRRVAPPASVP